jgi:uncharacterized protein HemX
MSAQNNSKKLWIVITVSISLVLLAGIGSWVYIQHQNINQRNKELLQAKQLDEYNQQQLNERAKKDRQCAEAKSQQSPGGYKSPFAALSCN